MIYCEKLLERVTFLDAGDEGELLQVRL